MVQTGLKIGHEKRTSKDLVIEDSPKFNREVFDWWRSLGGVGGSLTADTYLRKLNALCKQKCISPDYLLELDSKEAHSFLCQMRDEDLGRGLSPSTVEGYVKVYKSFLIFHDVQVTKSVKVPYASSTPTLRTEKIPTHEQLNHSFMLASLRDAVSILLMAQSGLRISTIGRGRDGLRVCDFPEMEITNGKVIFPKVPTLISVREDLSKLGRSRYTFGTEELCNRTLDEFHEYMMNEMSLSERTANRHCQIIGMFNLVLARHTDVEDYSDVTEDMVIPA